MRERDSGIAGWREWLRGQLIAIGIVAGVGVLLGLLGPFGTFGMGDPSRRIAWWLSVVLAGHLLYMPAIVGSRAAARALSLSRSLLLAVAVLIATLPMTLVVSFALGMPPGTDALFTLFGQVALIGLLVSAIFWWREQPSAAPAAPFRESDDAPTSPVAQPALLRRLPIGHDGTILALESEDHYVRVHGSGRSDLVLIRMGDAVAAAAPIDGQRVHRRWWVARDAVHSVERDGRTTRLRLRNGIDVPVSRENRAALRAAGWF